MTLDYWKSERALRHQTPPGDQYPEGKSFPEDMAEIIGEGTVLEFGCGTGRLSRGFDPEQYIGVDVSPAAVAHANRYRQGYDFRVVEDGELPEADAAFTHTVLLHVCDADLPEVVLRLTQAAPRVVVSEIMGRRWRRHQGEPPVFNREPEEYVKVFADAGFLLHSREERPYNRYGGVEFTVLDFRRPGP